MILTRYFVAVWRHGRLAFVGCAPLVFILAVWDPAWSLVVALIGLVAAMVKTNVELQREIDRR